MIDLEKYVIGLKIDGVDDLAFLPGADEIIKKQTEDCVVLLIPKSEWEKIKASD